MNLFFSPRVGLVSAVLLAGILVGCGGVDNAPSGTTSGGSVTPGPPPSNPGGNGLNSPTTINVGGGQTVSGIDISVPASTTTLNAQVLGVSTVGAGGSAFNTGGQIHRGTTMRVLLFGPGLSGDNTITIGGPNDISIGNVQTIRSTSGTPGVAFEATVANNAALGARTVFIRNSGNDVTAFTGGLEVLP